MKVETAYCFAKNSCHFSMDSFSSRLFHATYLGTILRIIAGCAASTLSLAFGYILFTYMRMLWQRSSLPPGPFPLPLVGNCLQLQRSKPWIQFHEWSAQLDSGLITIWIGRTPTVICNDAWDASELLDKRSSNFSSRPRYVVFGEVTGQSTTNQVILPYNDRWRRQRKVMVSYRSKCCHF